MSVRSRSRVGEVLLALLAIAAVVGLGLYAAPAKQAARQGTALSPGTNRAGLLGPLTPPIFGPNVRANSDATQNGQHEPSLAVSRVHTNTVVVASKDYRVGNQKEVWIDVSTDGGATWPANRQLQMPGVNATQFPHESDPVVIARDDGRIYVACLGYDSQNAVFITWTDDDGATWHNPSVQISPSDGALDDKDWFTVDNNLASPYYHRMYMMYAPGAGYVAEQHSTDGGLTWTPRQTIGAPNTEYTYPVIGSDGTVYNFMALNWSSSVMTLQLTKSTNGGVTWSSPSNITTAYQPPSQPRPGDLWRFFSILSAAIDPNNGNLYLAWTDNRNFNTSGIDVMYIRSTDGGASWTSATRLSHDPTNVLRDHITPVLTVGSDSKLHAFWLDRRLDPNNHLFDSWYSSSTDGGATWDPDTRVSTSSQDLSVGLPLGSGGAAGDYWGIDTTQDVVYVAWNDTRTGDQDIYVSKGLLSGGVGGTATPTSPANTPTATATPTQTSTVAATIPSSTDTPGPSSTRTSSATVTPPGNATPSRTSTVGPTATLHASATSTRTVTSGTPTPSATPTTPVPGCEPTWLNIPNPATGALSSVSAASRTDAWAVGGNDLIHWNGLAWEQRPVPTPQPQFQYFDLASVSTWSTTAEAWVAGSYSDIGGNVYPFVFKPTSGQAGGGIKNLAKAPEGGTLDSLYGIAAVGPGRAFAVGTSQSNINMIILDCSTTCTESPHQNILYSGLRAVWGYTASDAWAVGSIASTSLIMHFDGTSWTMVASPNVGVLNGVWGVASDDVWAVGDNGILRWNGSVWTQTVGLPIGQAKAVSGTDSNDVWVAAGGNGIWHWNGSNWLQSYNNTLDVDGIDVVDAGDIWAVTNAGGMSTLNYTAAQHFTDVAPNNVFYPYVQTLACRGIISGYPCGSVGEPCDSQQRPYFRTNNNVTRGQLSKIVAGAAGFNEPVSGQMFEDVAPGSTFYAYIQRLATRGYINGYPCGGPGEPCVAPTNRPYFRPNNNSTRGQISKIVSNAAGFQDPPGSQIFEDVTPGSTFYDFVQRLASRGVMQGYPCGGPGEPCLPPTNRPYFRTNNNATRGQTSKIVSNTFFP